MEMATVVTGDKYLESLVRFVDKQAGPLIDGALVLKLNPAGLHYVQSRLESLGELESLLAGAPVDYLRAYVSDLGDHRALEQLRRILRLLTSLKVVSVLPSPARDPTPLSLLPFGRLKVLELRGCDLSTSAARGLLQLRHTLEKLICHNSTDALRHVFASRIADIKDSPLWNRLSFVSCARNGLLLMDESLQLLPVVETLDLSRNKFAKVDNLKKCTRLKHLDLGFNHLRTVASFHEVSCQLVKLVLRNNALTTLRGIENLKCLEGLDLSCNIISNFSELEFLAGFPSLLSLWLEGNPLCCARWYRAQVFSIFPYPDKLKLDGDVITTKEFWKVQIIIASRQKQPASFGFYCPAKGDSKLEGSVNAERICPTKRHSRLACIESEESATHTNSDEESVACENETHPKVEEIVSDEETVIVDLVERIEKMKKEKSDLWLQEFKKWLILDSENCSSANSMMPDLGADKNHLRHKPRRSYLGESSQDVPDTVQDWGAESSRTILESDSSFTDNSFVFNSHHNYGGNCEPTANIGNIDGVQELVKSCIDEGFLSGRASNWHPDIITVAQGERKLRNPPYYQDDILRRRHNLVEEYLQLSAESFSLASSDSNTSCGEDDFSEYGPSISESDLALIEELSESSYSTLRHPKDAPCQKRNGVLQVAQNGSGISDSSVERSSGVLGFKEHNLSSDECGSEDVPYMKQLDDLLGKKIMNRKPKRRLVTLVEDITSSSTDGIRSFSRSKPPSLETEIFLEQYFNTDFAEKGVSETCRKCITCNCIIEHTTRYEGEVAILLSSDCKLYVMLINTNCDASEISISFMGCHRIEDVRLILVGLGLQLLRVYIENGGTYLFITRSIDKSRQLLCLLHCLDSQMRKQNCCTRSVEQVQVELFKRDVCGGLGMSIFQYAIVLFRFNNMKDDIWLSRSLFVLEQYLLVCMEDFIKCGSHGVDTSPYFTLHSCCAIIDICELVIDTSDGWSIVLTIERASSLFCASKKMEERRVALCPTQWKLKWFSQESLFSFVTLLKAIHAGAADSSSPLVVRCTS